MAANAVAISPVHRLMAEPRALVTVMEAETETEETVAVAAAIEMQHALQ